MLFFTPYTLEFTPSQVFFPALTWNLRHRRPVFLKHYPYHMNGSDSHV